MGISLSVDEVLEVAGATRRFAKTLEPKDTLAPAKVVPEALAALVSQPSVPGADAVVTVHAGAQEVVTATLEGVQDDLIGFAKILEQSVDTVHESEVLVERTFGINLIVPVGESTLDDIGNGEAPTEAENRRQQAIDERQEA